MVNLNTDNAGRIYLKSQYTDYQLRGEQPEGLKCILVLCGYL